MLKRLRILLLLLPVLAMLPELPMDSDVDAAEKQRSGPQEAAGQGLENLRLLVTEKNLKAMGFESPSEAALAKLGDPMQVFRVPLDELRNYQPNSDPERLLVDADRIIYPVVVRDIRSLVIVEKTAKGWQPTNLGSPKLAKVLFDRRKEKSDFIVWVPALNLYFVANRVDNKLMLTPVLDDPNVELSAGRTLPADKVFSLIVPAAKSYNGLPN